MLVGGSEATVAGRLVPRVYKTRGREASHRFLVEAIESSGGVVLYASPTDRAPFYFGVQLPSLERVGLLVYPITISKRPTVNRPVTESRGQLRYGREESWVEDHVVGRDLAGVDVTLMLGIDDTRRLIVSLDPSLYDPMPLGISVIYLSDADADAVQRDGLIARTHVNRAGRRNADPRTPEGLETWVGCRPDRFLEVTRFERNSYSLGLDQALRYTAALHGVEHRVAADTPVGSRHELEMAFNVSATEILEVIKGRHRLEVAVRGGIAEFHLERVLQTLPWLATVHRLDQDGKADFEVTAGAGDQRLIECKNVSPDTYASGEVKVEVQKTRTSKNDPSSRFYPVDHFDVVAACLYSVTHTWEFRYARTTSLDRHRDYPDRIAALQRVDDRWTSEASDVLP